MALLRFLASGAPMGTHRRSGSNIRRACCYCAELQLHRYLLLSADFRKGDEQQGYTPRALPINFLREQARDCSSSGIAICAPAGTPSMDGGMYVRSVYL